MDVHSLSVGQAQAASSSNHNHKMSASSPIAHSRRHATVLASCLPLSLRAWPKKFKSHPARNFCRARRPLRLKPSNTVCQSKKAPARPKIQTGVDLPTAKRDLNLPGDITHPHRQENRIPSFALLSLPLSSFMVDIC
jgi:hypothetical protein